ncbi:response regulator [Flavobacterium suzhouense]|uniref:Response regulator n=1 Tax=Flavobacterium suzhouense TaxID=1529638 RepID=A0ABW5NPC2_9FLAO
MSTGSCFLVDDDADDREIFAMALKKAHASYVCDMAKNGADAIKAMQESDIVPGYIFVDLNMPMISGKECVEAFKKIYRLADVPVIVYTTSSHPKDVEDIKNAGADHYLVKPNSFSALVGILEELLTKKELPFYIDANN